MSYQLGWAMRFCAPYNDCNKTAARWGGILENIQILVVAINDCKNKLTTVAQAGEGKLQLHQNEGARNERAESGTISFIRYGEDAFQNH